MARGTGRFAVVEFPEEDFSLAVVHASWIDDSRSRTYWPSFKSSSKLRRVTIEGATPSPDWGQANCAVKAWADTYEDALEKQRYLEYNTDISCEEELGRGKRKKRSALASDYDTTDSSGDDANYEPPRPPTPPPVITKNGACGSASSGSFRRPVQQQRRSEAASARPAARRQLEGCFESVHPRHHAPARASPAAGHQLEGSFQSMHPGQHASACASPAAGRQLEGSFESMHPGQHASACASPAAGRQLEGSFQSMHPGQHASACASPAAGHHFEGPPVETSSATSAMLTHPQLHVFMERVLCTLNHIKMVQQTHTQLLTELRNKCDDACIEEKVLPDLPFQTLRDLVEWDGQLATSKEAKLQMKRHMLIQGGDCVRQKTTRILKSLLSWDLAKQFSWYGAKGKKKFSELNMCQLLCTCLTINAKQNQEEATLKNVEKAAMTWFRHAAERAAAGSRRPFCNDDEAGC